MAESNAFMPKEKPFCDSIYFGACSEGRYKSMSTMLKCSWLFMVVFPGTLKAMDLKAGVPNIQKGNGEFAVTSVVRERASE